MTCKEKWIIYTLKTWISKSLNLLPARVEAIHEYIIVMLIQKDFILSPALIANAEQTII
jgi:hypothetical protein